MAQTTADVLALQLEKVRAGKALPVLFDYADELLSQIEARKDVEKVSSRETRIPLQDSPGSAYGMANLAGGALGRGSATHYAKAGLTPLAASIAVEINEDVLKQTDGEPKAVRKIALLEIKNAMNEFRRQLNGALQTAGDGVLATVTAAVTGLGGNVTVKTAPFYAQLLRAKQTVTVYDAALAAPKGTFQIDYIDTVNSVLYATAASTVPGTTIPTDVLLPNNVSGATPASFYGIPYHISDSAVGTWMTLARATTPQVRASRVNAGSNALTTAAIRLVLRKITQRVGKANVRSLRAHLHGTQLSAYEELAILASKIDKGSGNEAVDLLFGDEKMAGVTTMEDILAARNRIDFLNFDNWGRVESAPVDFLKRPDGSYFERPIDATTGSPVASILFYIIWFGQFFTDNPAAQGYISDLAIPAGYNEM